jgi:adenylate cyclase
LKVFKKFLQQNREDVLPQRVRDAIRAQENATERLISWMQLAVVGIFAALYGASEAFMQAQEPGFDLVPYALSIYLVLTLIRLAWSHMARLPGWSLALSVIFDMTLLMVLIWSFHIEYQQPASFYLKAPTLLYVFIFIALRALRFDARFVVLAGIVASLGWGVLILYVVYADPADSMITRDYVAYMTSNAILLGAEFDKIFSILMVTALIAVAIWRAKGLLVRAVAESAAAQDLSRFFAPEVAQQIRGAEHAIRAGQGEVRQAAILNLDMRGFTRLAEELPPHEVMQILADYQSRMGPIIRRHGGSIDKFLGDGIMATFGASRPSETGARDGLTALMETMAAARAWARQCEAEGRPCPPVNGAVATGRVVFGAVGDGDRLEYTVIGDAVNLSAKIEKYNRTLGVAAVATQEAWDEALRQGLETPAAPRHVNAAKIEGVDHPVDLVVVAE